MTRFEDGHSTLEYTPKYEHQNSFGVAHGGSVMTLLDVAMATAARSVAPDYGVVTIEMKTSFMAPAPGDGSLLTARGHLLQRTAKMAFVEGSVFDSQGRLCAHSTGTFKYVKRATSDSAAPAAIATD